MMPEFEAALGGSAVETTSEKRVWRGEFEWVESETYLTSGV